MGLDSYWVMPVSAVGGVEPGDTIEYMETQPNGEEAERTHEVESEADAAIPTGVLEDAGLMSFFDADDTFSLTGGMLSGHGPHSFRGKVYNTFIKEYTGESLYQHEIPNSVVQSMADDLQSLTWGDIGPTYHRTYDGFNDEDEFKDFKRMFRTMADSGAHLVGWW